MVEDWVEIRRATATDADVVAGVYLRARRHAVPDIPPLRGTDDSVRGWLEGVVLGGDEVWVAETDDKVVVAMMLLDGEWIEQLFTSTRRGWVVGLAPGCLKLRSAPGPMGCSSGLSSRMVALTGSTSATGSRRQSAPTGVATRNALPTSVTSGTLSHKNDERQGGSVAYRRPWVTVYAAWPEVLRSEHARCTGAPISSPASPAKTHATMPDGRPASARVARRAPGIPHCRDHRSGRSPSRPRTHGRPARRPRGSRSSDVLLAGRFLYRDNDEQGAFGDRPAYGGEGDGDGGGGTGARVGARHRRTEIEQRLHPVPGLRAGLTPHEVGEGMAASRIVESGEQLVGDVACPYPQPGPLAKVQPPPELSAHPQSALLKPAIQLGHRGGGALDAPAHPRRDDRRRRRTAEAHQEGAA